MRNFLKPLQDPSLVCQFQSYFGVEKLAEVENVKNGAWIASEVADKRQDIINELGKDYGDISYLKHSKENDKTPNGSLNGHSTSRINSGKEKDHNTVYYKVRTYFLLDFTMIELDLQQVLVPVVCHRQLAWA